MVGHISRVGLFLEVVKHQSFAAAARNLGITGPALSKQVRALEDQLGVRLLNRTTRQVTLTEQGAIYSERARKALEDLSEAEAFIQDLKETPKGILRINAPMSFGKEYLAKPIAKFAKEYPKVKIDVDFDDRKVDIISEGYDVVIRIGTLDDSSLIARHLALCPIILCASPEFINRYGTIESPESLRDLPGIIYTKHGKQAGWQYISSEGQKGTAIMKECFYANNAEMLLQACIEGVGVALLPAFTASEHLKSGKLKRVLINYSTYPERSICAIFPQNRYLSIKTRLFIDMLTKESKKFPWV